MRLSTPLILFLLLVAGCSKEQSNNTAEQNFFDTKKAAEKVFKYFNEHDWEKMANCYDSSALFLDPSFGKEPLSQTRSQIINKYTRLNKTIPDIHDSITQIITEKNIAVIQFVSTGTLPNGSKLKLPICSILTFKDGLVIKDFTYYDN
jgi:hypothetical protein